VSFKGSDSLVGPDGVTHINPHLHNDFLQIAAERGLPALALWVWFLVALMRDLWQQFKTGQRELAATAMATVVALLTAGLFEYNFGDSEVLMLFLTIVTLPAAAARRQS
jgi:O-antigen ligase